ncbi:hypothetical protein [Hymenobacter sp. CRA2]|uniref:hypothetical protein n=1 Tax=Hymenobacter sp. CRA2 TaxID=1955620 RepID=UPI00098EFEE9|nr:hypothetical protein [Hymenobacter sp. CRA2]OON68889.1 hypothetical protein B0919_12030 [Hymenobacter sp. CRA2]
MEPTPKSSSQPDPKQPNPAANTLPTKGTPDSQRDDAAQVTNLPRPANTSSTAKPSAAPQSDAETPTPDSQAAREILADPSAADIQPDTHGDTDPGASHNNDAQPL